jgi:exonuclease SbcC
MIIQSVRLKNIKSYGEGPQGTGVTVNFENGVNRVTGRNGHGKTTLIESIGYALFLTEPQFEENFQIDTYLLRYGAKEGEIEVTFSCEGGSYRIERVVGKQTKRRAKVIQLSDQSLCAEGNQEVSEFLCRLLKFPEPRHLSEIFCKLVGVKQGRLTWPFDSKPTDAKRHFEPLLAVDVFRECFDRMKGAVAIFEVQRVELLTQHAAINERINERATSPEVLASTQQKVAAMTAELAEAAKDRDVALALKNQLESASKAVEAARTARDSASQIVAHAKRLREDGEKQFEESKAATQILVDNDAAHKAHVEAAEALAQLEVSREKRDAIRQNRDNAEKTRVNQQSKSTSAGEQAKEFGLQAEVKKKDADVLRGKINPLETSLETSAADFQKSAKQAEQAEEHRDVVGGWIDGLENGINSQERGAVRITRLAKEISKWDEAKLKVAEKASESAGQAVKEAATKLNKAEQRHTTLEGQLQEIGGGICPFLKEKCRQFDPSKVRADLEEQKLAIKVLAKEAEQKGKVQQESELALGELRTAQAKISQMELELAEALESYSDGLRSLVSDGAVKSSEWLAGWAAEPGRLPTTPKLSPKKIDPARVAILQEQIATFGNEAKAWWVGTNTAIRTRIKTFNEEAKVRKAQESTLREYAEQLVRLNAEVQGLSQKAIAKESEAKKHEEEVKNLSTQIEKLDAELKPFGQLDADLKREQLKRDANRVGHERYLGAKKTADDLAARQARLTQLRGDESTTQQRLLGAQAAVQKAEQEFDAEKLKTARADHQIKHDRATALQVSLATEKEQLSKEEKRFKEWEEAGKERDRIATEIGRCEAAKEITELARKTLRDSAPAVAQHLCNRIANRAQGIFNEINPDPVELGWDAERYSLRVKPGDRRFAMLSGGEQTKLALAMTLAMIEEFSGLRFCIFDEPTYGVDADSRHKLADAIIQAQQAAGLNQLLLVSHDDAFEGKSEHAILLEKSATLGTGVVLTQ